MTSWGPKAAITGNRGGSKKPNKWGKRGGSPKTPGNGQQNDQGGGSKNTDCKGKGESSVADRYCSLAPSVDITSFKYDNHYTYPDSLLMVPLPQAISIIVAQISIVVLESMCYRATIHTIDCDLPHDLSLYLLAGLKYMMPTKYDTELISKS